MPYQCWVAHRPTECPYAHGAAAPSGSAPDRSKNSALSSTRSILSRRPSTRQSLPLALCPPRHLDITTACPAVAVLPKRAIAADAVLPAWAAAASKLFEEPNSGRAKAAVFSALRLRDASVAATGADGGSVLATPVTSPRGDDTLSLSSESSESGSDPHFPAELFRTVKPSASAHKAASMAADLVAAAFRPHAAPTPSRRPAGPAHDSDAVGSAIAASFWA